LPRKQASELTHSFAREFAFAGREVLAMASGLLALFAPWPWTIFGIKPTNDALLATGLDHAGPSSRALIVKWGGLHAVRTALGAIAVVAFLWACMSGKS
jgi:hypothetical protein